MKEKKKAKKKSKKHKKKKSKYQSDSESLEDEGEWEEAPQNTEQLTLQQTVSHTGVLPVSSADKDHITQREDWMNCTSLLDTACNAANARENRTKQRKTNERRKEEEENQKVYESRELNPSINKSHFSQYEDEIQRGLVKGGSMERNTVGDRGQSWIRKAYERAKEQAKEENIPLEDIVIKRWGSMGKLKALLKVADRTSKSHSTSCGWRKHGLQASNEEKSQYFPNSTHIPPDKLVNIPINAISNAESLPPCTTETARLRDQKDLGESFLKNSMTDTNENDNRDRKGGHIHNSDKRIDLLTEHEKNDLNAKLLRAELMGDNELVINIRKKLEGGEIKKGHQEEECVEKVDSSTDDDDEEVILTRSDKHGNLYPVKLQDDDYRIKRKKKIMSTHDESGKRVRYFEDDDKMDLKTMVEQERLTSADDHLAMLSRLAGKHLGRTMGDDYTIDDMFVAASATKGENSAENNRIKKKAISDHKLHKKQLSSCQFCYESSKIAKHMIVSIGVNVYLTLPTNASLTDGHCLIVPLNHIPAQTFMDENVLEEFNRFKSSLVTMFAKKSQDVVFIETSKNIDGQFHCAVECIPVSREIGDMAPLYFRKAITESESEWSQNKKLITFTANKGLTKSLPKGLPYFAVEFGLDGGFGHIIEEVTFPLYFGKEVIGGMMDLYPGLWLKPPKESFEQQKRKLFKFMEIWKSYDWTKLK